MKIKSVKAIEILDSRGKPTLKAVVELDDGAVGWAMVPSGVSTGNYEAMELRDGDDTKYGGSGVLKAVRNVNGEIASAIMGMNAEDQEDIDRKITALDGTDNKGRLGANAILSISLAAARAAAVSNKIPLYLYLSRFNRDGKNGMLMPMPMMNVMNGGKHADWATDIQEYMIIPVGAKKESDAVRMCAEIYASLKKILKSGKHSVTVGDEGGFAPDLSDNEGPFKIMAEAITVSGYSLGGDMVFGMDAAASEFHREGKYTFKKEGREISSSELADFYRELSEKYPIVSFEDIFAEDDWQSFSDFTASVNGKAQIVGDDLYATNIKRLERGIAEKSTNSILIKPNQIGTLTETVNAVNMARAAGMTAVISHRSGETEDPFIADLAVGMGTGQIKAGAPCRGERTAKYNRLIEIEEEAKNIKMAEFPFTVGNRR